MPHRILVESIITNNCSIFAKQYQPFEMIYYRLSEQYRKQQEEFFSPCCQILHPYWMPVVFMFGLDKYVKRGSRKLHGAVTQYNLRIEIIIFPFQRRHPLKNPE